MDIENIVKLYTIDKWSLRMIAEKYNTNHHLIKRILVNQNIKIVKNNNKKTLSDEHKIKISESRLRLKQEGWKPYNFGKKSSKISLYKNMMNHLKYDVSLDWLMQFEDIEKLKVLNKSIIRNRDCCNFDTDFYKSFIEKFYYDEQFNRIYERWLRKRDKYSRPSLDHIIPKSKGGELNNLNNLQFLTWFENRAKCDLSNAEWQNIKENISDYLV